MFKPCVVIPVFDHEHAIGKVLAAVRAEGIHCLLVDDGSGAACRAELERLAAGAPLDVTLLRHEINLGKGGAVLTGLRAASDAGYTHALQIDGDGQHNVADLNRFLQAAAAHPAAMIVGYPQYDDSVPRLRLYARYLTHVWVWINTLSFEIRDAMCGFRVYPLPAVLALMDRQRLGLRMNFDIEVLVRLYWSGITVINLPTKVGYPTDGISHFRAWLDNALITRLHTQLFFGMLLRAPRLLARSWFGRRSTS